MAGPITGSGPIYGYWKQPSTWGKNESGNFQTWVFEGTPNAVRALAAFFSQTEGLAYQVIEGFGKFRLEVRFPWNADGVVDPTTDFVETWELFAEHTEKDLLESQDNAGLVATLSLQQKEQIRAKLLNPPDETAGHAGTQQTDFAAPDMILSGTDKQGANSLTLYQLMQAGMKSYLMEAPRLRRTIITSNQYAVGYSLSNVRKLLATSYIAAHEGLPTTLLFNLVNYTSADNSSDPLLVYGWYKFFPTISQVALLKYQIVQEWAYGWWPKAAYGTPLT